MRGSDKKLNPALKKQIIGAFIKAISDLKDEEETGLFFKDFLTDSELEAFSKRFAIAYWLEKGRTYDNILANLKTSSATIATAQEEMKKEGYKLAIEKLIAEEWATKWAGKIKRAMRIN